jgi:hypothetical protein
MVVGVVATFGALGLVPGSALATTSWSSYSVTPASLQAGASPNLAVDMAFSNSSGDSAKSINLTWAPGLSASPASVATCTETAFENIINNCTAASEIASGTAVASILDAIPFPMPATLYMLPAPSSSDLAGLGLNVSFLGLINVKTLGAVDLSSSGQVEINFDNVPDTALAIIPFQINTVTLTVDGTVAGKAFTVNPSDCSSLTSTALVSSYKGSAAVASKPSSFTPTGCGSLGFSPSISGGATPDASDSGVATTLTINQNETANYPANDARLENFALTFPTTVAPNFTALDGATGQQVGTISVDTPLLTINPTGALYLEPGSGGALPSLKAVIASPVPLTFNIALSLGAGGAVTATLDGLPDLPLSTITITLPGGPSSLLQQDATSGTSANLTSTLTGWNGATTTSNTPFSS